MIYKNDQVNASLLNKSIPFFWKKKNPNKQKTTYWPQTFER